MDRIKLKNIILAVAHQILSTCTEEQLENAIIALTHGDPISLKPHKPVILEDYELLVQKMTKALAYKPICFKKKKVEQEKPSNYPNLFTVTVPMEMDVSKLSNMERQILYQNLDKMLLVTMHPPFMRGNDTAKMLARIGIPVQHLYPEQKAFIDAKEDFIKQKPVEFYKKDVAMACLFFMPMMLHHFYRTYMWQTDLYGVPP